MPGGRPTKLTPEVQEKILLTIRGGNYREVAAEWVGISPETLSRWMTRRRAPYIEFRQAVLEAERDAEITALALVMDAAVKDPRHAEWWLERKFHDRWGRKDKVENTGQVTHKHEGSVLVIGGTKEEYLAGLQRVRNGQIQRVVQ